MMKNQFKGYYSLNKNDFSYLWKNCTFILDANILLNLYRYPQKARDDFLLVLNNISDRLWIPYQAALEYQRNRLFVVAEQLKKYDRVEEILTNCQNSIVTELGNLQLKKRHPSINPDEYIKQLTDLNEKFKHNLNMSKNKHSDVNEKDEIRMKFDILFSGKIGSPPKNQEELDSIYKEAQARYEKKIPPGYMDDYKQKASDNRYYFFDGLIFQREYGDYLIWREILQYSKQNKCSDILFITDDEKEDWWWIEESHGEKKIGPRPELINEIQRVSKVKRFYMYNSERFLEYAKSELKSKIMDTSIEQIKNIKLFQHYNIIKNYTYNFDQEKIVLSFIQWLSTQNPKDKIVKLIGRDDIDLYRETEFGKNIGYIIKPFINSNQFTYDVNNIIMNISQKRRTTENNLNFDHIVLIFIMDEYIYKNQMMYEIQKIHKLLKTISIIIGEIDIDEKNEYHFSPKISFN